MRLLFLYTLLIVSSLSSCKKGANTSSEVNLDMSDAVMQQIYNFRDKRASNELKTYLQHENSDYRYAAAMSFASFEDSTVIFDLARLLDDSNLEVRRAAAFALGQQKRKEAVEPLIKAFQKFSQDSIRDVQATILEAVGKCGDKKMLFQLATAPNYKHSDTRILEGQAASLYQFALRDSILPEGTRRMIELATAQDVSESAKVIAAGYLSRAKGLELSEYEDIIKGAVEKEKSPSVKMLLVNALGKAKTITAARTLEATFNAESDYRVRCNILRTLKNVPYDSVSAFVYNALQDNNPHVKYCAADYFYANGTDKDAENYRVWAAQSSDMRTRARLYAASLHCISPFRTVTKVAVSKDVTNFYNNSTNLYEKTALLESLAEFGWNYTFIKDQVFPLDSAARVNVSPVIASTGITALGTILKDPSFSSVFGFGGNRTKGEIVQVLMQAVSTADAGMVSAACETLADANLNLKTFVTDSTILIKTEEKLAKNPFKNAEALKDIRDAISYISGKKFVAKPMAYSNPIDWGFLASLPPNAKVFVETERGSFAFRLFLEDAPLTVINFVKLARAGFYNGKVFHRVVSNFVIQTGCDRGDGYGGIDDALRTEISMRSYNVEGMIGMARDDRDTEGSQWFVTHSAALHLTGNYTIFGQITDGMDVVHKMLPGDKIVKVEVK
jgi:cyclophilin family peptidyl-prolyl cis-trans isomerase/HEAT repeat protein